MSETTERGASDRKGARTAESDAADESQARHEEFFDGDTGTCPASVRHALAALIKRRYISADKDKVAWEGLMSDVELVRSRLADLWLSLKVDRVRGIALVSQVELENDTVPYKVKSIV